MCQNRKRVGSIFQSFKLRSTSILTCAVLCRKWNRLIIIYIIKVNSKLVTIQDDLVVFLSLHCLLVVIGLCDAHWQPPRWHHCLYLRLNLGQTISLLASIQDVLFVDLINGRRQPIRHIPSLVLVRCVDSVCNQLDKCCMQMLFLLHLGPEVRWKGGSGRYTTQTDWLGIGILHRTQLFASRSRFITPFNQWRPIFCVFFAIYTCICILKAMSPVKLPNMIEMVLNIEFCYGING